MRDELSAKDVAFEIRFALGQARASLFIAAHARDAAVRRRAIDALTDLVAARFEKLAVTRELRDGWQMP